MPPRLIPQMLPLGGDLDESFIIQLRLWLLCLFPSTRYGTYQDQVNLNEASAY